MGPAQAGAGPGAATALGAAIFTVVRGWPRLDRQQVAAAVEHQYPELGQQVGRPSSMPSPDQRPRRRLPGMVKALLRQTADRTTGLDFQRAVPWSVLRMSLILLAVGLVPLALGLLFQPDLRTAVLRTLLVPASYTTLKVEPGEATIRAGEDLIVNVTLKGRPVPAVRWFYRQAGESQSWRIGELARPGASGQKTNQGPLVGSLAGHLEDCRSDLEYYVTAGELESPIYRVRVIQPLTITRFEATVEASFLHPPAGRGVSRRQPPRHRRIACAIHDRPEPRAPARAGLALGSLDDPSRPTIPLEIQGARLAGSLPTVTADQSYEIVAEAADGVSLDPARYRIQVQPDEPPTVRFVRPDEELAVIPTAEVPIEVQAGDDFGLARIGIAYRVGKGAEESLLLQEHAEPTLDGAGAGDALSGEAQAQLHRQHHLSRVRGGQSPRRSHTAWFPSFDSSTSCHTSRRTSTWKVGGPETEAQQLWKS